MADQKQVLDMQVSKGITAAQSNEHLRDRSERAEKYAMNKGNYDPTRKHLNFEIAPGGKVRPIDTSRNIPERMADILERRGIKDPNEGLAEPKYRTVVNFIFGGSRKRMHPPAPERGDPGTDAVQRAESERLLPAAVSAFWMARAFCPVLSALFFQSSCSSYRHLILGTKKGHFFFSEEMS